MLQPGPISLCIMLMILKWALSCYPQSRAELHKLTSLQTHLTCLSFLWSFRPLLVNDPWKRNTATHHLHQEVHVNCQIICPSWRPSHRYRVTFGLLRLQFLLYSHRAAGRPNHKHAELLMSWSLMTQITRSQTTFSCCHRWGTAWTDRFYQV